MGGQLEPDSVSTLSARHTTGQASPQPVSCASAASLSVSDASELQLELDDGQLQRMQAAVEALLVGLGEDVQRQGLRNTPKVRSTTTISNPTDQLGCPATCVHTVTDLPPPSPRLRSACASKLTPRLCVPSN